MLETVNTLDIYVGQECKNMSGACVTFSGTLDLKGFFLLQNEQEPHILCKIA